MVTYTDPDQSQADNRSVPAEPFVRVGPLMSVPSQLRKFDYSPENILGKAGFSLSQFEDPDTEIPCITGCGQELPLSDSIQDIVQTVTS